MMRSGLRRRWMVDNLASIIVVITLSLSAFALAFGSYYYSTATYGLRTRARSASAFFSNYITASYNDYYNSALEFVAAFEEKNYLELQFINTSGKILISSYGLPAGDEPGTNDITQALQTSDQYLAGERLNTGERIMAVSAPLYYGEGGYRPAHVTSLKNIDRRI